MDRQGLIRHLKVHPPKDRYEQEADRTADEIMRGGKLLLYPSAPSLPDLEQRHPKPIQGKENAGIAPSVDPDTESSVNSLRGHGTPIAASTRKFFENRFHHDFRDVRIHDDAQAAALNRHLNARAFTFENHIALGEGEYARDSESGERLLAHELTHVVQQGRQPNTKDVDVKTWSVGLRDGKLRAVFSE